MSDATDASDLEQRLAQATDQALRYAQDLRRMVAAERAKSTALAAANLRLQVVDRLKSDFLSFISHELRTPLNAIGAIEMLDGDSAPEDWPAMAELIRHGYDRLHDFVSRGLAYFDVLALGPPTDPLPVDLVDVVRRAAANRPALAPSALTLTAPAGVLVSGDPEQLATVVDVLLDNACAFSRGTPRVTVTVTATAATAHLTVVDAGRGFPPELALELFQPFTVPDQLHHARGSGLSLAIARAIVERHGGTIRAHSEGAGTGATFAIALPLHGSAG